MRHPHLTAMDGGNAEKAGAIFGRFGTFSRQREKGNKTTGAFA